MNARLNLAVVAAGMGRIQEAEGMCTTAIEKVVLRIDTSTWGTDTIQACFMHDSGTVQGKRVI